MDESCLSIKTQLSISFHVYSSNSLLLSLSLSFSLLSSFFLMINTSSRSSNGYGTYVCAVNSFFKSKAAKKSNKSTPLCISVALLVIKAPPHALINAARLRALQISYTNTMYIDELTESIAMFHKPHPNL